MKRLIALFAVLFMIVAAFASLPGTDEPAPATTVDQPVPVVTVPEVQQEPETGVLQLEEQTAGYDATRGPLGDFSRGQYHPSDYGARFTYWLVNENISVEQRKLSDISKQSDPYHAGKNKADVNLTRTTNNKIVFTYPNMHSFFSSKLNPSPQYDPPVLNLTINTLGTRDPDTGDPVGGGGKVLNFEMIIDTNGDYDPYNPNSNAIEGRIDFGSYTTLGAEHSASNGQRQEEELVELTGTWTTDIPQQVTNGRVHLQIWRTDTVQDDASDLTPDLLIYCGFAGKASWLALPYPHPMRHPHADAGEDQGNVTLGQEQIREYDTVYFNGTKSYDPQDDLGADGQADTGDQGENNKNIDNGVPSGETDLGEVDNLEYKWDYGVGAQSSGWQSSPYSTNKYHLPSEWKSANPGLPYTFQASLNVRDNDNLMDTAVVNVTVYPYDDPPDIKVMEIRPDIIDGTLNVGIPDDEDGDDTATVMVGQEVKFYAEALNNDPNEAILYMWDLNGDGLFDVAGGEGASSSVKKTYDEAKKGDDALTIGLRVYDADPESPEATYSEAFLTLNIISEVDNLAPVAKLKASVSGGPYKTEELLNVPLGEIITLDASESFDQDSIGGFDTDGDDFPDEPLMFKYEFGNGLASEGTFNSQLAREGFVFDPVFKFNYTDAGNENFYVITLTVHDGFHYDTTTMNVHINLRPVAEAGPSTMGAGFERLQVGEELTFDGSESYDPNDDSNGNREIDPSETDNLEYIWDFGDGSPLYKESYAMSTDGIDNDGDGMPDENKEAPDGLFDGITTHDYNKEATYTVKLTVEDDGGMKHSDTIKVFIQPRNKPPTPVMQALTDTDIFTGKEVQFTAADSFDTDGKYRNDGNNKTANTLDLYYNGDPESVFWNFGDGNTSDTIFDYGLVQYKQFDKKGRYEVTVTVTDEYGLSVTSDPVVVNVKNRLPRANAGSNLTYKSLTVFLQGEQSWDPDGKVVEYKWNFGDGSKTDYINRSDYTHTYEEYKTYQVTLWVKDNDGDESRAHTITVNVIREESDPGTKTDINKQITFAVVGALAAFITVAVVAGIGLYYKKKNEEFI